jgi:hypothetical protein
MVTLAYFLLLTLLTILITLFDMSLFEFSFFEAMINIVYSEIAKVFLVEQAIKLSVQEMKPSMKLLMAALSLLLSVLTKH